MTIDSIKDFTIPFRVLWLRSKDAIDLRFSTRTPDAENWSTTDVIAHVVDIRLVGISIQDHKRLGLGRWLRSVGQPVQLEPDDPLPSETVRYDEAGRIAYFSIWPRLSSDHEEQVIERPGKIYFLKDGTIARIRFPVTDRRGRSEALGPAAGLLATR